VPISSISTFKTNHKVELIITSVDTLLEFSRGRHEAEKRRMERDTLSPEPDRDATSPEPESYALSPEPEPSRSKAIRDGEEWAAARGKEQAKGLLGLARSGRKVSVGRTPAGKRQKLWNRK